MQEKNMTLLVSWMEQVSIWDHGMDPGVQSCPNDLQILLQPCPYKDGSPLLVGWWVFFSS